MPDLGQSAPPVTAPGAAEIANLQSARKPDGSPAFSSQDIAKYQRDTSLTLMHAGFSVQQIEAHWGMQQPQSPQVEAHVANNIHRSGLLSSVWGTITDATAAFEAGWGTSVTGMSEHIATGQNPNKAMQVKPAPGVLNSIAQASGQMIGDLPASVLGFFGGAAVGATAGGVAGGAAGAAVPVAGETGASEVAGGGAGAVVGAFAGGGFGAGAAPQATREVLLDAYNRNQIHSFSDFLHIAGASTLRTLKAGAESLPFGFAGPIAGKLGEVGAKPIVAAAGGAAAATALGVSTGAALDGRMPDAKDFVTAAATMLIAHGAYKIYHGAKSASSLSSPPGTGLVIHEGEPPHQGPEDRGGGDSGGGAAPGKIFTFNNGFLQDPSTGGPMKFGTQREAARFLRDSGQGDLEIANHPDGEGFGVKTNETAAKAWREQRRAERAVSAGEVVNGVFRPSAATLHVQNNLEEIYRRNGTTPWDAINQAKGDPGLRQEILQQDVNGSSVAPRMHANAPAEPPPLKPAAEPAPEKEAPPAFTETKRDPDGTIFLNYTPKEGGKPLQVKMAIDDGVAQIAVNQFGKDANSLGPAQIRAAMAELKAKYPEITSFEGFRRTGAGVGRVQSIAAPPAKAPISTSFEDLSTALEGSRDDSVSPAGAIGKHQIMLGTARQYGFGGGMSQTDLAQWLHDPANNAAVFHKIAADLHARFHGDMNAMLIAYNAGPGRAGEYMKAGPGTELEAIPDKTARSGIRYESVPSARDESFLPMETQKYLANGRRRSGGATEEAAGGAPKDTAVLKVFPSEDNHAMEDSAMDCQ